MLGCGDGKKNFNLKTLVFFIGAGAKTNGPTPHHWLFKLISGCNPARLGWRRPRKIFVKVIKMDQILFLIDLDQLIPVDGDAIEEETQARIESCSGCFDRHGFNVKCCFRTSCSVKIKLLWSAGNCCLRCCHEEGAFLKSYLKL